jgi:hypothetical protein
MVGQLLCVEAESMFITADGAIPPAIISRALRLERGHREARSFAALEQARAVISNL